MIKKKKHSLLKGIKIHVKHGRSDIGYEVKEVFIGHRTIFSLLGFIVGGLFVGRSVWEYLRYTIEPWQIILLGFLIFVISGIMLHEFHDAEHLIKEEEML